MLFQTEILSPTKNNIQKITTLLMNDGVIALPTETVYGLAGNATSDIAAKKIFKAKDRPDFDPLIVHVSSRALNHPKGIIQSLVDDQIISEEILNWPSASLIEKAMKQFWPGPLTFILPRGRAIPDEVTSKQPTVGVRMPNHPLFQEVLAALNFPLAAPSANRFGRISPTSAEHVMMELNGRIAAILDGGTCTVGVESTIISLSDSLRGPLVASLLRPGKISSTELEKVFGISIITPIKADAVVPGSLENHYAPTKPLILVPFHFSQKEADDFLATNLSTFTKKKSVRAGMLATTMIPRNIEVTLDHYNVTITERRILSAQKNLSQIAQSLFRTMRELDQNPNVDLIIADLPSAQITVSVNEQGLKAAIQDRLRRASVNKPL